MQTERTDRERAIFLAERVMGWECLAVFDGDARLFSAGRDSRIPVNCDNRPSWNPLTDPVASKQVIDRMIERGRAFQITQLRGEIKACFWISPAVLETYFDATGPTRELAVADAAIAAIEGEQG